MRCRLACFAVVLTVLLPTSSTRAQWQPDGVPVCTNEKGQWSPKIVSDGSGGAIVTWNDYRINAQDVYVQRLNAAGVPQWTEDGVAVCTAVGDQYPPTIVSDDAGGAIVMWNDDRDTPFVHDIYAQRVDAAGVPLWEPDGVPVCTASSVQFHVTGVPDGEGGAILVWGDYRDGGTSDIYAQRIDASGVAQWTEDGVPLCTATDDQENPMVIPDGLGGAIVTWRDYRGPDYDIYAQRVDASGAVQWTEDGVAVCTAGLSQHDPMIAPDGAAGAIITWWDYRNSGFTTDVYAQRVSAAGDPLWTPDGVVVSDALDGQQRPRVVSDDDGGAIIAWFDYRNSDFGDVYAQRLDALGAPQWTLDGVALCTDGDEQRNPILTKDGSGGAIVAWEDYRTGHTTADVYAQRVTATGTPLWTTDGLAVCAAANDQLHPTMVSDGADGAIVTWEDYRDDWFTDIYAQRVPAQPNAVAILSFDAVAAGGFVTLKSAFRSNLGVEGIKIYRAPGAGDDPMRVIARLGAVREDRFEYADREVTPGQTYRYRIGVVDADGEFLSPLVTVSVDAIADALAQNRPNPFNPTTTIRFVLAQREPVTLAVFDANGRRVRTLVDGTYEHGAHDVTWDGRDDDGAPMGSGVYFYRLRAGKHTESRKMVLLK